jgi:hypothetical protein
MSSESNIVPFPGRQKQSDTIVSFDRRELNTILSKYGQLVAAGEWRDYALNMTRDAAIFSVFKRAGETPAYRIEKRPKNAAKQGQYAIIGSDGRIEKRGHDLRLALRIFDRKLLKLTEGE